MITITVQAEPKGIVPATVNVQCNEAASEADMRVAWESANNGTLHQMIRDAIWFQCVARGVDPRAIITDDAGN